MRRSLTRDLDSRLRERLNNPREAGADRQALDRIGVIPQDCHDGRYTQVDSRPGCVLWPWRREECAGLLPRYDEIEPDCLVGESPYDTCKGLLDQWVS